MRHVLLAAAAWWLLVSPIVLSQAVAEQKIALLAGVNKYERRGFDDLRFAERDVEQLAAELTKLGFRVVLLKGSAAGDLRATRKNIIDRLDGLLMNVAKTDVVLVALSGHGAQLDIVRPNGDRKEDAFFCPVDAVADEPDTLVSISYLLDDLLARKGGRNLVLIDACRNISELQLQKGKRKGVQGRTIALQEDTAVLFSCRAGEFSQEIPSIQHGLFTWCVLDGLRGGAAKNNRVSWSGLVSHVQDKMESDEVRQLLDGAEQTPIPAGGVKQTILGTLALAPSQPPSKPPTPPVPTPAPSNSPAGKGFEGTKPGELKVLAGKNFRWCPKPEKPWTMGTLGATDNEKPVDVTLSSGYWMQETEVTQGQWTRLMNSAPWKGKNYVKEGDDYAASYISHGDDGKGKIEKDSATAYVQKLTQQERNASRLPAGWRYALPTEAQWEYACRAGTSTAYSFGDDESRLSDYGWWGGILGDGNAKNEQYAHRVGLKKPNPWNLQDMHGNVGEWCADWYGEKLSGGRDPSGPSAGSDRVIRGGGWGGDASRCRSAYRWSSPDYRSNLLGFRVAVVPSLQPDK